MVHIKVKEVDEVLSAEFLWFTVCCTVRTGIMRVVTDAESKAHHYEQALTARLQCPGFLQRHSGICSNSSLNISREKFLPVLGFKPQIPCLPCIRAITIQAKRNFWVEFNLFFAPLSICWLVVIRRWKGKRPGHSFNNISIVICKSTDTTLIYSSMCKWR